MLSTRQAATPSEARADAPNALHVRTPQLSGHLWKRGFRFRRKWVRRWVALVGREVLYWAESDRPDALSARRPRGRAVLAPGMRVTVGDTEAQSALGFTVVPGDGEPPWHLRAESEESLRRWLGAFERCAQIASWLSGFKRGRFLGEGSAGTVFELLDGRTGKPSCAVKEISIPNVETRAAVMQEAKIMQRAANSPYLLRILRVYEEAGRICLAMPLCLGGDLYDQMCSRGIYTELDAALVMRNCLTAVSSLHSLGFLHLDIKRASAARRNTRARTPILASPLYLTHFACSLAHVQPRIFFSSVLLSATPTVTHPRRSISPNPCG